MQVLRQLMLAFSVFVGTPMADAADCFSITSAELQRLSLVSSANLIAAGMLGGKQLAVFSDTGQMKMSIDVSQLGNGGIGPEIAGYGSVFAFTDALDSNSAMPTRSHVYLIDGGDVQQATDTPLLLSGSIALSEEYLAFGTRSAEGGGNGWLGRVTVVDRRTSVSQVLTPPDQDAAPEFGVSIALDGSRLLIGAPQAGQGGRAYLYDVAQGAWRKPLVPDPDRARGSARIGRFVAFANGTAVASGAGFAHDADIVIADKNMRAHAGGRLSAGGNRIATMRRQFGPRVEPHYAVYDLGAATGAPPVATGSAATVALTDAGSVIVASESMGCLSLTVRH